jgi:hypothetical protein
MSRVVSESTEWQLVRSLLSSDNGSLAFGRRVTLHNFQVIVLVCWLRTIMKMDP